MASECACGGACHQPVPNDAAGLVAYLRERLERPGIAILAETAAGITIYVPKARA